MVLNPKYIIVALLCIVGLSFLYTTFSPSPKATPPSNEDKVQNYAQFFEDAKLKASQSEVQTIENELKTLLVEEVTAQSEFGTSHIKKYNDANNSQIKLESVLSMGENRLIFHYYFRNDELFYVKYLQENPSSEDELVRTERIYFLEGNSLENCFYRQETLSENAISQLETIPFSIDSGTMEHREEELQRLKTLLANDKELFNR